MTAVHEKNGGDIVASVFKAQGVEHVFTLCGGHISPILVSSERLGIKIVDCRDEKSAAFAADAAGRMTGVPGVVDAFGPDAPPPVAQPASSRHASERSMARRSIMRW